MKKKPQLKLNGTKSWGDVNLLHFNVSVISFVMVNYYQIHSSLKYKCTFHGCRYYFHAICLVKWNKKENCTAILLWIWIIFLRLQFRTFVAFKDFTIPSHVLSHFPSDACHRLAVCWLCNIALSPHRSKVINKNKLNYGDYKNWMYSEQRQTIQ